MTRTASITIKEMNQIEIDSLLADPVYSRFIPVKCNKCGKKTGFNRRIFHISGVLKKNHADDVTQNLLSHHLRQQHKVEYVFFRTNANKLYADSANCQSCQSTAIVFNLVLDDVMIAEYAKIAGGDKKSIKANIEALAKKIASRDRKDS